MVVLESFSRIVGVMEFDLEDICTFIEPRHIDTMKITAHIADERVLELTCARIILSFVVRSCGCRVVSLLAFRLVCCSRAKGLNVFVVIVVRNISKFGPRFLTFLG